MVFDAINAGLEGARDAGQHADWFASTVIEPARSFSFTEMALWAASAATGKRNLLKSRRSKYGSLEKLADGEPYFVLRAQDMLAPELIEAWAIEAELNGCPADKVADARAIAAAMRKWRKRKMPD